jgi:hypothetical protein
VTSALRDKLARAPRPAFVLFVGLAAMTTYFCMYAFRRPFVAGTYAGMASLPFGLDFKTLLIVAQVLGYAISKFIGIRVISELRESRRASLLIALMAVAETALVLFALLPAPWNACALFLNGLPLGMVWGIVFSYLEGRRVTEALGVILSVSLIFASGVAKSIGRYLLVDLQVPELWMPALVGVLAFPLLALCVWALEATPPPDAADKAARQPRVPMNATQRAAFLRAYAPGIAGLVLCYVILTAFRDLTDSFAVELWIALGYGETPSVFTTTTLPVIAGVLVALWLLMFVRSNARALQLNQLAVLLGFVLLAGATFAYQQSLISGVAWMVALQLGLYLAYIPFNCLLFERLAAAAPHYANAGFLIYIADSFGYLGSIGVLLYKSRLAPTLSWVSFVADAAYLAAACGATLAVLSILYFARRFGSRVPAVALRREECSISQS